jgi:hypothetical protein
MRSFEFIIMDLQIDNYSENCISKVLLHRYTNHLSYSVLLSSTLALYIRFSVTLENILYDLFASVVSANTTILFSTKKELRSIAVPIVAEERDDELGSRRVSRNSTTISEPNDTHRSNDDEEEGSCFCLFVLH